MDTTDQPTQDALKRMVAEQEHERERLANTQYSYQPQIQYSYQPQIQCWTCQRIVQVYGFGTLPTAWLKIDGRGGIATVCSPKCAQAYLDAQGRAVPEGR